MISDDDIQRALDYLRDKSEADAQARAERLYLEAWVKTVLAQEQAKAGDVTMAKAEMVARTSEAYIAALQGYKQAIFADEKARFLRGAAETKIDVYRTMAANERGGKI